MRSYHEVAEVHRRNFLLKQSGGRGANCGIRFGIASDFQHARLRRLGGRLQRLALVQLTNQFEAAVEEPLAERLAYRTVDCKNVLAEVLEVLAIIEDIEEILVLSWCEQVRAQTRTPPQHLPELGLRAH